MSVFTAASFGNINAAFLNGTTWAAPGAIGGTTPAAGTFTTLRFGDGSVGTPGLAPADDTDNGIYRIGANNLGVAIAGAKVIDIGSNIVGIGGIVAPTSVTLAVGPVAPTAGLKSELFGIYANTNASRATMGQATATVGEAPAFQFARSRGTMAAPTAMSAGDWMGAVSWSGYNDAWRGDVAYIGALTAAGQAAAGADFPSIIVFYTTSDGSATAGEKMRLDDAGNLGLGVTAFGASGAKYLGIGNGTTPTAAADMIHIGSRDNTDGAPAATLSLVTEAAAEVSAAFTQSHRLRVWHNGTEYYISLDAV